MVQTAPQVARPDSDRPSVVHITLRALPVVGRLRNLDMYAACRIAQRVVLAREAFRLIHYSIQHNHVHLIVEADATAAPTNGLRAFRISLTKRFAGHTLRTGLVARLSPNVGGFALEVR